MLSPYPWEAELPSYPHFASKQIFLVSYKVLLHGIILDFSLWSQSEITVFNYLKAFSISCCSNCKIFYEGHCQKNCLFHILGTFLNWLALHGSLQLWNPGTKPCGGCSLFWHSPEMNTKKASALSQQLKGSWNFLILFVICQILPFFLRLSLLDKSQWFFFQHKVLTTTLALNTNK